MLFSTARKRNRNQEEASTMWATRRESEQTTVSRFIAAARAGRPVTVDYVNETGEHSLRTVEPHEVDEERMLVKVMCRLRGEYRTFRLDRVTHYTVHRGTFQLEPPAPADPDEVTDWWSIKSRSGHEILQVHLNTDGKRHPYGLVLGKAREESGQVRAVCKAEGGVSIRRLRRRDVLAHE